MRVLSPKLFCGGMCWRANKRRRVELSAMLTVSFPLFSSLLFPLFSSLFVQKGKRKFPPLCWCWLLLNPDSRAQRENQDLLCLDFFSPRTISFFFANERNTTKNNSNHHRPLLFIDSSYINAPNTHTYKMALSMQSALAGKQITVNKVSSKRYVYLIFAWWSYALNYDCPFFCFIQYALFFFGRDWRGKIDDGILLSMFVYSHSPLLS